MYIQTETDTAYINVQLKQKKHTIKSLTINKKNLYI